MPSEYEELVAALKLTDIPFAEYGWKTRPEGAYGVVRLDMEADSMDGDGGKQDRAWEASVDVFYEKLTERGDLIEAVEEILAEICGDSWWMNSMQHESDSGMFHIEWACRVMDHPGEDEPETEEAPKEAGEG